jgi:hypothetical protein
MKSLLVILLLSGFALAKDKPAVQDELFGEIDTILADLGRITGWTPKRKVPASFITRDKLRQFIDARMKKEIRDDEIRVEEQILEMFGLVPRSFDLRKSTIDLITEQAAAFYDYNSRRLYVLETNESTLERRVTLAHELAHALADQQFSLKKYIRGGMQSDDMATARQAVVEGQATWLMWAYMAVRTGKEPGVPIEVLANAGMTAESAGAGFPVLAEVPLYLRESLIFPYTRGLLFQQALFKSKGKESFTEVFTRPPDSSRQILHPEVWEGGEKVKLIEPPVVRDPKKELKLRAEGTIGEFDHHVLIREHLNEDSADRISPLWRGGAYRLFHMKGSGKPLLAYASEWDKPETATWYLALYKGVLAKKARESKLTIDTPDRIAGSNEYGSFEVWRQGSTVYSIEGKQR